MVWVIYLEYYHRAALEIRNQVFLGSLCVYCGGAVRLSCLSATTTDADAEERCVCPGTHTET